MLLIWLAVLSLPTLLAEDAPHFLRGSGVLPLLFCAPALGLVTWARRPILGRWWLGPITALVALGVGAALDLAAYARHMRSEAAYYQFESGAVELAAEINSFRRVGWRGEGLSVPAAVPHADRRVYIAARLWRDWPSLRYLSPKGEDLVPLEGGASTAQPPA
ncbi:MAG: hypothetical protein H5T71_11675, partial [Chloroflexi bacterium]|nr:hypothetical protein [Chloroflexota bacterium]